MTNNEIYNALMSKSVSIVEVASTVKISGLSEENRQQLKNTIAVLTSIVQD